MSGTKATQLRRIRKAHSVYVDAKYGDDTFGLFERLDKPFKTIRAAWDACNSFGAGTFVIHIANGIYSIGGSYLNSIVGRNFIIKCESRYGVVVNVDSGKLIACASNSMQRAQAWAENQNSQHDISKIYDNYEALVADPDVQGVYVANTHNFH